MSPKGPHIDQQLERQFDGFHPEPPDGAWNRISATLDRRNRHRKILWWSSAAVLLLICSLSYFFLPDPGPQIVRQDKANSSSTRSEITSTPEVKKSQNPLHVPQTETPIRFPESIQYIHPNLKNASHSNVQSDAPYQEEAADHSVPLPQGFGISGKGIEMLPHADDFVKNSMPLAFKNLIPHRRRLAAPALEIGMVVNPSINGLNLRLASTWSNYVHEEYLGIRRSQESPLEAIQCGVELSLRLRGGIRFNSGLWFVEQGYRQEYKYDINKLPAYRGGTADLFGNRLIEGYFIDPTPEQVRYHGTARLQMIQVPFQAGYEHRLGLRGGIMIHAGTAASFLLSSEGMNINYSNLQLGSGNNNWFRNTQWSALGSISCFRQVNPFIRIGLGIRRAQALSNQYISGSPLIGKGGNTGIQVNLHYRIY